MKGTTKNLMVCFIIHFSACLWMMDTKAAPLVPVRHPRPGTPGTQRRGPGSPTTSLIVSPHDTTHGR